MSFLNKIKDAGHAPEEAAESVQPQADGASAFQAYAEAYPASAENEAMTQEAPSTQADSIITEATVSELNTEFNETQVRPDEMSVPLEPQTGLPLIGKRPLVEQQRALWYTLGFGVVGVVLAALLSLNASYVRGNQINAAGQALTQSQRMAKSVSQALLGKVSAFDDLKSSTAALTRNARGLENGDPEAKLAAAPAAVQTELKPLMPLVDKAEKNAKIIMDQEPVLTKVHASLSEINTQSSDLADVADALVQLKVKQNAPAAEVAAAGQLVMLVQRITKSANEFLTVDGVSTEAVFLLGKDLNTFADIANGFVKGNADYHLPPSNDPDTKDLVDGLLQTYEPIKTQATFILSSLQGLVAARDAQGAVVDGSEPLRKGLENVGQTLSQGSGIGMGLVLFGLGALAAAIAGGYGLLRVSFADRSHRTLIAEHQRLEAERQQREAKRVNDANQAAILRLMNELQTVAEGDLTQQATVTEDITGAIADSVNFTVEELRNLVSQVQGTVLRVTETTQQVESTSTELLAASDEQLREIRETGESVLQMAGRINDVSAQALQSADVARQSLIAAESGLSAVQNAIGGMNAIREQIQDTSKRIKRLGESSQEIGEITELISDITEQTNVLALNAAIQAASAGDAGRGFSVVAQEVQRLAERSADATRQIAALVQTIQTDTQDAVAAMERSTQGVVEGAKLSDAAGTALNDIDRVSRRLAELIQEISHQAQREAESANVVVSNIQHIFAVTEQTGEGTRSTTRLVRELSKTAEELKQSVSRFKIS